MVTWVGFKQSLRNGPSEEAPCRRKDAVRQHRRAFRDIRDEQRNIAAGDGIRRTVSPCNDDFAFDQSLDLTCASELAHMARDEEGREVGERQFVSAHAAGIIAA